MEKSYMQKIKGESFDWWVALENVKFLQGKKLSHLTQMAGDWVTCATGNQCDIIPRDGHVPKDWELDDLGMQFYYAVRNMRDTLFLSDFVEYKTSAMIILAAIESRSAEIITKLHHEKRIHPQSNG